MTKRRAERLTGYEIRELPPERGLVTVGAFEGEKLVVKAVGRADFIAYQALVNGVYFFNSRKAMQQHGWRCARCRSSRRLEIHHRKYRSHGGTHRVENLEPVCRDCHKLIHRAASIQERLRLILSGPLQNYAQLASLEAHPPFDLATCVRQTLTLQQSRRNCARHVGSHLHQKIACRPRPRPRRNFHRKARHHPDAKATDGL